MNDQSSAHFVPKPRVALLVDGENLSASRAEAILDLAHDKGDLLIRRVYGKLADLQTKGWASSSGFRLMPATNSKNSADLLLSVDAMELALDGKADCIVIAASDNDYSHVAIKLRERGFPVFGLIDGAAKCGELRGCYASVCDLPSVEKDPTPQPALTATPHPKEALAPVKITKRVLDFLTTHADASGYPIASLGAQMHKQHGITISTYPEKTWRAFLNKHTAQFDCDPKGPNALVRLRR